MDGIGNEVVRKSGDAPLRVEIPCNPTPPSPGVVSSLASPPFGVRPGSS
jgi:hypothetical protein